MKVVQKYWKGNSYQICLNLIYFNIIMSPISRGSVTMNNESFFSLRCQLARPTAASRWLQPPPVILIHLSSHPLGDFMSELVIITGDCFLTFLLRSIRSSGAAPLGRLSLSVWECLRSGGRQGFTSAPHTSACTSRGETGRLEHDGGNCGSIFGSVVHCLDAAGHYRAGGAGSCDMGISSRVRLKHYSTFVILPGGKELRDLNVLNQFNEDVEAWARCCALIRSHWPFLFLFTNFIGSSTLIISAPVTHILIDLLNIYSAFFSPL